MKKIKKAAALLLSLLFILGMTTNAFAAESVEDTEEDAIQIYTVTFVNCDKIIGMLVYEPNTRLDSEQTPEATREADKNYTYTFDKWVDSQGREVVIVDQDMIVYASYIAEEIPVEVEEPKKDETEDIKDKDKEKDKKDDKKSGKDGKKDDEKVTPDKPDDKKGEDSSEDSSSSESQTDEKSSEEPSTEVPSTEEPSTETVSTETQSPEVPSTEKVDIDDSKVPGAALNTRGIKIGLAIVLGLIFAGYAVFCGVSMRKKRK